MTPFGAESHSDGMMQYSLTEPILIQKQFGLHLLNRSSIAN